MFLLGADIFALNSDIVLPNVCTHPHTPHTRNREHEIFFFFINVSTHTEKNVIV